MRRGRGEMLIKAHQKLQQEEFDMSLFLTIVFLVIREGFEIALFTASVSLFSAFMQNFIGLLLGFVAATVVGIATFFAYVRFPIGRVFKVTEYMIILLGASLVQNGITMLFETHFGIHLSEILSFNFHFLPNEDSFFGHMLKSLFGIDQGFSAVRLAIMLAYIGAMYFLFIRGREGLISKIKNIT